MRLIRVFIRQIRRLIYSLYLYLSITKTPIRVKPIYFIVAALAVLGVSCTENPDVSEVVPASGTISNRISVSEAIENASKFFAGIEGTGSGTRAAGRPPATIQVVGSANAATRSGVAQDTMLYLVNYDAGQGFALLGADRRLSPVYAIAEEGSLDLRDTVENMGLALFMRDVQASIQAETNGITLLYNKVPGMDGKIVYPDPIYNVIVCYKKGPRTNKWKWGQDSPFNKYCMMIDGKNCKVGCVAVATAMLMAWNREPSEIDGFPLDWDKICSVEGGYDYDWDAMEQLTQFLSILGRRKFLNMQYGLDNSTATSEDVRNALGRCHYSSLPVQPFDKDKIIEYFDHYCGVVIMDGGIYENGQRTGGHEWIVGGCMDINIWYLENGGPRAGRHLYYLYCNWGWKGLSNGWYKWSNMNPIEGPELTEKGEYPPVGGYNFQNLHMILNAVFIPRNYHDEPRDN